MSKKYREELEKITVSPELKEKILRTAPVRAKRRRQNVYKYASLAACFALCAAAIGVSQNLYRADAGAGKIPHPGTDARSHSGAVRHCARGDGHARNSSCHARRGNPPGDRRTRAHRAARRQRARCQRPARARPTAVLRRGGHRRCAKCGRVCNPHPRLSARGLPHGSYYRFIRQSCADKLHLRRRGNSLPHRTDRRCRHQRQL